MAAEIVNLNRVRKVKTRAESERRADENRIRFGRTKSERARDKSLNEKAERDLDSRKIEDDDPA
ncbi:MAG: DUF4169 family protein [Alphaproteobacteria bacterium]|nr:DUF4169 family protein [Alphaproteobacteria bacterium]